ncbi:DAD family-domain-containing protein [Lineolata rhizophorae]|uniref:Dolichyl-diphosphooligosaccharide--protein glycosyltransferase subunit OST2 n=1 Tax=Lineolata rhizophorae TaxID=578093 RepID=A0A6A6P8V7_9PEZI|nr:DAD family-domain-containing protein [Lineolata rhizophorae]
MGPKNRSAAAVPASAAAPAHSTTSAASQPTTAGSHAAGAGGGNANVGDAQAIVEGVWRNYVARTPQRVKLLDAFMGFLAVVGALQFVYCVLAGNYPFNAFLSGFSATVGQFVLTASLRIQTNPENRKEFSSISDERAFADYIFGSLILHFFCVNFIN